VAIPVEFDEALLETVTAPDLPADWTEEPPPSSARAAWLHVVSSSAVCAVSLSSLGIRPGGGAGTGC